MKLADFFVKLGVVGDTKELDKTIKQMEKATSRTKEITKYRKDLAKATTDEEKALVKKNFADKIRIENLKKEKAGLEANKAAFIGAVKGITGFIAAATVAYKVVDNMVNSLAKANQQLISFQRQTGISFASLNKYASANAAVNINSTVEGTAQSMQRVAQNLWDIRMGRGDISPYQELAYVGGKAFNPMGMSVEQVIESVRDAIKGVGDIQATNIITRMGFAPDDLIMLRMSREEFEKINSMFLNPQQREAMNKYSLELNKINLEFKKSMMELTISITPIFTTLAKIVTKTFKAIKAIFIDPIIVGFRAIEKLISSVTIGFKRLATEIKEEFKSVNEVLDFVLKLFREISIFVEDIIYYFQGKNSYIGVLFDKIGEAVSLLDEKFESSGINKFFKAIENGIAGLINLNVPQWVKNMFGGEWVKGIHNFTSPDTKNEHTPFMAYNGTNPVYIPNTSTNNTITTTNNDNNWNVSIATNQPISNILNNLSNQYGFAQASYSGLTA